MGNGRRKAAQDGGDPAAERTRRGPKPTLQLEEIVAGAIALADAEGVEAVTMQRLAQRFGFTPMSLYRYVRNKAELVDAMAEAAIGPPSARASEGPWQERLDAWAHALLKRYGAHPWTLVSPGRTRAMGPNELGWVDQAVAALATAGLTPADQHGAFLVLIGHVRSAAQFAQHPPDVTGAGPSSLEHHPALQAAVAGGAFSPRGQGFARGLQVIFEGIAAAAAKRRGR